MEERNDNYPVSANQTKFAESFSNNIKRLSAKPRLLIAIITTMMLIGGIAVYVITPKVSDIERLQRGGNFIGMCELIEKNAKTNRHIDVLALAAERVLQNGDQDTVERLSGIIGDKKGNTELREAIIAQFGEQKVVIPRLFEYLVDSEISDSLKAALVVATNMVDRNIFDEKVEAELANIKNNNDGNIDNTISAIKYVRVFDVNATKFRRIDEVLYSAYVKKLKGFRYPAKQQEIIATIKEIYIECKSYVGDPVKLKSIEDWIKEDGILENDMRGINDRIKDKQDDINKKNENAKKMQDYLQGCWSAVFYVVDRNDNGTYDVVFDLWNPYYRGILKTYSANYTTQGWSEMMVRNTGTQTIRLQNGERVQVVYMEEDKEAMNKLKQHAALMLSIYELKNEQAQLRSEASRIAYKRGWTERSINAAVQGLVN